MIFQGKHNALLNLSFLMTIYCSIKDTKMCFHKLSIGKKAQKRHTVKLATVQKLIWNPAIHSNHTTLRFSAGQVKLSSDCHKQLQLNHKCKSTLEKSAVAITHWFCMTTGKFLFWCSNKFCHTWNEGEMPQLTHDKQFPQIHYKHIVTKMDIKRQFSLHEWRSQY